MNIWFGAKDASLIQTSGSKTENSTIFPPYFSGEIGSGYGKMWEKGTNVRISRLMW
jgi:hypothetical protein